MSLKKSKSVIKRQRQTKKRTARNRSAKNELKTLRKRVNALLAKGDIAGAKVAEKELMSRADKAAKTGIIPRNKASNIKMRTALNINKAAQKPQAIPTAT